MTPTDQLFAGRYRLEDRLGVGGMSTVQKAFDTRLERYVAVKLLAEHLAADQNFVQRFRREALAAARLVHPNVVQVYDFGTDDATQRQFIVMECVTGQSCAEILRERGTLPPEEAVDIVVQACRGLDYAHRNGVVHRDVKPGNLLRNHDRVVKLADFGIAKAAEDSDITRVGSVIGTAAYLAPEQSRGEPAGPQSDLYALGVVAYQLMTGRLPYQGSSLTDLARQQESGPPTAVHEIQPGVRPELSAAVMRALSASLEGRYTSAPEMERAFADAMRGIAPPPSEDRTLALAETEATRMLSGERTAATRAAPAQPRRRQLEPLPQAAPPARARRREAAAAPAPARRKSRVPGVLAALFLVAAILAGVYVFGYLESGADRTVQLREQVRGDLETTIEELKALIDENRR